MKLGRAYSYFLQDIYKYVPHAKSIEQATNIFLTVCDKYDGISSSRLQMEYENGKEDDGYQYRTAKKILSIFFDVKKIRKRSDEDRYYEYEFHPLSPVDNQLNVDTAEKNISDFLQN